MPRPAPTSRRSTRTSSTAWLKRATRIARSGCFASGTCGFARAREQAQKGPDGGTVTFPSKPERTMLHQVIDRRLAGKNKSIGNRERFLRRYREQIRDAGRKAVGDRSIKDIEEGTDISLPKRDVGEPIFHHGSGGTREIVHPGNREYIKGDRIQRPQSGGGGSGGPGASDDGQGEDDF